MDCLKCNSAMKKMTLDGVLIDKCGTCQGVWLDANELDKLKYDDRKDKQELLKEATTEVIQERKRLLTTVGMCPKCQRKRLDTFVRSGVEIDQCPACSGLFFDHGELQKVIANEHNGMKKFLYGIKKHLVKRS
jgi:Zn-finger nucleic acid-binding protein